MKKLLSLLLLTIPILAHIPQKPIVVIIPSYNNERWCIDNIKSVLQQEYDNYSVIFMDDNSSDATYTRVAAYVAEHDSAQRVMLIHNTQRYGALANLYTAIWSCPDEAIVATLDGDDTFAHTTVLATINAAYQNPDVWLTYGQFIECPPGRIGFCRALPAVVIEHNLYREYTWVTSHLRTFYAGLFKHIKREDLLFEGAFFDVTWDRAFMLPMLEMAAGRIQCISEVLYVYNQANPLNDFRVKLQRQEYCRDFINKKEKYQRLPALT